jgi:hypothetical protein
MRVRLSSLLPVRSALMLTALLYAAPLAAHESATPFAHVDAFQPPMRLELARVSAEPKHRPAALIPLYGSLIALQGLDIHSTRSGMHSGQTREANPLMGPIVENGAAFVAVKAAATVGAIWCAEKMWKKSPKKALVFTVLINATMAAVVTHNYRLSK